MKTTYVTPESLLCDVQLPYAVCLSDMNSGEATFESFNDLGEIDFIF